jgi:hypothetical protein
MNVIRSRKSLVSSTSSIEFGFFNSSLWVILGYSPRRIGFGFMLTPRELTLEFLFFWITVEV